MRDLQEGIDSRSGEPFPSHSIVESVPEVYLALDLSIPGIAYLIDPDFGREVREHRDAVLEAKSELLQQ